MTSWKTYRSLRREPAPLIDSLLLADLLPGAHLLIGPLTVGLLHRALRDAAAERDMRLDLRSFLLYHLIIYAILLTTAATTGMLLAGTRGWLHLTVSYREGLGELLFSCVFGGWFVLAGCAFGLDRRTRELEQAFAPIGDEEEEV